ncbi:ABC transporter ATP-binding protein [Mycoplasmopsis lipofaciens]|uniref:ABC transporter ATP-binding protein n=1 Tax=Mycoplasmopsis lipofaciens TaxID=114884 RepID=UPI0004876808|nr:ABC transporter ATP-binding protein [Mycoplasmopsis lipofaciens]
MKIIKKIQNYFREVRHCYKTIKNAKVNSKQKTFFSKEDAIVVDNLSKFFKIKSNKIKVAVDNISFVVKKGSFHGFIGDNGAGKTTTIRTMLGFYSKYYGNIYINGINSKNKKCKNIVGYIPEVAIFPKKLTIREYLMSFAKMSNLNKNQAKNKVDFLIKKFGFNKEEFNKSAADMSSGQKKKVLLMQALLNDPQILIMDEPAANLDPSARVEFYESIKELNKEGITILISSHILLELEKYIDSFTVLSNGKVLDSGLISEKLLNNKYNVKIKTKNNNKLLKILSDLKIKHMLNDNYVDCKLTKNSKNFLLKEILKNKLEIIEFKENKLSLNELYFKAPNNN